MDRSTIDLFRSFTPNIILATLFIAISCRSQELNSLDRTAIRALDVIVDRSIKECREYGGEIKMSPFGPRASDPVGGGRDSVSIPITRPYRTTVAMYHTHGCFSIFHASEVFSDIDTMDAEHHQYLITPRKRILKFDHVDRMVYELDRRSMTWRRDPPELIVWNFIP